jgi:hypothetical protein
VQIAMVVANTQVRTLRNDVGERVPREQQLHVGQSVLSQKRKLSECVPVHVPCVCVQRAMAKGNRVNIP